MKQSHLYIKKSKINGSGLYTSKKIKKGHRVGLIKGEVVIVREWTAKLSQISPNWIGIGRYSWINTKNSPFKYINHSCQPNTYIIGKRTVIALNDIEADTEVTMDYSLTESDKGWCIESCGCKSKNCRKFIGPITSLSLSDFKSKKNLITDAFKKVFLTNLKNQQSHKNIS